MKRRHKILLTLGAGAIAERYILREARGLLWTGARYRAKRALDWYASGGSTAAAWRLSQRLQTAASSEEENPF